MFSVDAPGTPTAAPPRRASLWTRLRPSPNAAREESLAAGLAQWIAMEVGVTVRGDPKGFVEDMQSGEVLCLLARVHTFNRQPTNAFKRIENFHLARQGFKTRATPPMASADSVFAFAPVLVELSRKSTPLASMRGYFCVMCARAPEFASLVDLRRHLEDEHVGSVYVGPMDV